MDGKCSFGSTNEFDYEQFDIEFDGGHFFFINNRLNGFVMQSDPDRQCQFVNTNRQTYEAMSVDEAQIYQSPDFTIVDIEPRY